MTGKMAKSSETLMIGELIGTVQAMDNRITEVKKDISEGFLSLKTHLTDKATAHDKRLRRLERWRDWIVGGVAVILLVLIPAITALVNKFI